jgi:hypothetical protein
LRIHTDVPSVREFTSGNSTRVCAAAERMKSVTLSHAPEALSSTRRARSLVMSTATVKVNCGTVVAENVRCSAITRRIRLRGRGPSSSSSVTMAGTKAGTEITGGALGDTAAAEAAGNGDASAAAVSRERRSP